MRKLGPIQEKVLRALREHKSWTDSGCGWIWRNQSVTLQIMESLVRAGAATVTVRGVGVLATRDYRPSGQYGMLEISLEKAP